MKEKTVHKLAYKLQCISRRSCYQRRVRDSVPR